jgi:hypothetical protein
MAPAPVNIVRADQSSFHPIDNRYQVSAAVADIYNWFTEGFDLPDLKEARALLDTTKRVVSFKSRHLGALCLGYPARCFADGNIQGEIARRKNSTALPASLQKN